MIWNKDPSTFWSTQYNKQWHLRSKSFIYPPITNSKVDWSDGNNILNLLSRIQSCDRPFTVKWRFCGFEASYAYCSNVIAKRIDWTLVVKRICPRVLPLEGEDDDVDDREKRKRKRKRERDGEDDLLHVLDELPSEKTLQCQVKLSWTRISLWPCKPMPTQT